MASERVRGPKRAGGELLPVEVTLRSGLWTPQPWDRPYNTN